MFLHDHQTAPSLKLVSLYIT